MCLHQRRQLRTMEQRRCQSQSNGCVCRDWRGRGVENLRRMGEKFECVPNVQADAKTQCGTLKAKGRGWVGDFRTAMSGGVSYLGK